MSETLSRSHIKSVLVFGAKDHIGSHVVNFIHQHAPHVHIKVATHQKENLSLLEHYFPFAEAVVADVFDLPALTQAVAGVEGIFQVSPDVFDEDLLVKNMKTACEAAGTVRQIIRILGTPPGATIDLVAPELRPFRHYPAMQHLVATQLYREAGLPVTFLNVAGYFMDDFSRMFSPPILNDKVIQIAFDKTLAWIDPQDVAEVGATLLLEEPESDLGTVIDLTGPDLYTFREVAALFTETLGVTVTYDDDPDRFFAAIKPVFSALWGEDAPEYFMKYFKWETDHDHLFHVTSNVKRILKREPRSFQTWLLNNRDFFLGAWAQQADVQIA